MLSFCLTDPQRMMTPPLASIFDGFGLLAAEAEIDIPHVLVVLLIAFTSARVAGELAERLGQPAVVGELAVGLLIGPSVLGWIPLTGSSGDVLEILAELGVIVLLFQVGLETEPAALKAVGRQATAVGVLGIVFPFVGGFGVSLMFGETGAQAAFVATALVATSVGITARVLADIGKLATREARVILGAAVIDDVLGLLVLAVVVGASQGSLEPGRVVILLIEAIGFVGVLLILGSRVSHWIANVMEAPKIKRAPFSISLIVMLALSVAAAQIELAAIVGAFLAGSFLAGTRERYSLEHQTEPLADFLTPFFFVFTGAQVELDSFTRTEVLAFASVITVVAIVGKLAGGWLGARGLGPGAIVVGVGMIPRGEVGIIVASLGLSKGIIGTDLFGAVLVMVIVTTLISPPLLAPLFRRRDARQAAAAAGDG
ncbi:MAG TPA: cation:proton antiporter [Actinomycetota bacterium]